MKLFIPTNRPHMLEQIDHEVVKIAIIFDGSNIPSYSWMINQCIAQCKDEDIIIIVADKTRPTIDDVNKIINKIESGFGFVGLYRFGFYGIHMDAVRRIGPLDERYVKGTYEDCDYLRRFKEANIAYFESEEIPYINTESFFNPDNTQLAVQHFNQKWNSFNNTVTARLLPEEKYEYNLGKDTETIFLPWKDSILCERTMYFVNLPFEDRTK